MNLFVNFAEKDFFLIDKKHDFFISSSSMPNIIKFAVKFTFPKIEKGYFDPPPSPSRGILAFWHKVKNN